MFIVEVMCRLPHIEHVCEVYLEQSINTDMAMHIFMLTDMLHMDRDYYTLTKYTNHFLSSVMLLFLLIVFILFYCELYTSG
jgi:hypothetical protein